MLKNFFILSLFVSAFAEVAVSEEEVLAYLALLPNKGVVKEEKGFFYIDLDDAYIHGLQETIKQEGFSPPPYFGNGLVGAHITLDPASAPPIGTEISFTPISCEIVNLSKTASLLNDKEALYVVVVDIPSLPRLQYPYHITVGVK